MIPVLYVACIVTTVVTADRLYYDEENAVKLFEEFIKEYDKAYDRYEKPVRYEIFKENLRKLNYLNSFEDAEFGINRFADLSAEEMAAYMGFNGGKDDPYDCEALSERNITTDNAPPSLDHRQQNIVTPVKNQGMCGSCWLFSSIGALESSYARSGRLLSFSEQQLLDCLKCSKGCTFGGLMAQTLSELMTTRTGVMKDSDYPYLAHKASCQYNTSKAVATVSKCKSYAIKDENKLKEVLFTDGPLAVGIYADDLGFYSGGILGKSICADDETNHAVLLVGYGTENGQDFWLIKNSWGTDWGEQGYLRISRGQNTCGIVNNRSVAVVAGQM